MQKQTPHLIFATHFSESCYAAIPLVAQCVDSLQARLTLLHVPVRGSRARARQALDSFFAESATYAACERVLGEGRAEDGIVETCRRHPQALLVMPPSERTGLPRLLHTSLRARVLQRIDNPMLTMPQASIGSLAHAHTGAVACWLDVLDASLWHLQQAIALARHRQAPLYLMHVLSGIDEPVLPADMMDAAPQGEAGVRDWLERKMSELAPDLSFELMLAHGNPTRQLRQMLKYSDARVLVMRRHAALKGSRRRPTIEPALSRCDCLLLCVPCLAPLPSGHARSPMPTCQ
jgi:nucleotide-binding universal stress UspA family protein